MTASIDQQVESETRATERGRPGCVRRILSIALLPFRLVGALVKAIVLFVTAPVRWVWRGIARVVRRAAAMLRGITRAVTWPFRFVGRVLAALVRLVLAPVRLAWRLVARVVRAITPGGS